MDITDINRNDLYECLRTDCNELHSIEFGRFITQGVKDSMILPRSDWRIPFQTKSPILNINLVYLKFTIQTLRAHYVKAFELRPEIYRIG